MCKLAEKCTQRDRVGNFKFTLCFQNKPQSVKERIDPLLHQTMHRMKLRSPLCVRRTVNTESFESQYFTFQNNFNWKKYIQNKNHQEN